MSARRRLAGLALPGHPPGGTGSDHARRRRGPGAVRSLPTALLPVIVGLSAGLWARSPVAALIAAGYTLLGMRLWRDHRAARRDAGLRTDALDLLAANAAELRAGTVGRALLLPDDELDRLVHAAHRLADSTGAPLADLLERLETQCREADRAGAAAQAQAAGAQLTAVLLAALPVGGLGLGYLIGVDAMRILLHTPTGIACAAGAAVLQTAGLAWTRRLQRGGPVRHARPGAPGAPGAVRPGDRRGSPADGEPAGTTAGTLRLGGRFRVRSRLRGLGLPRAAEPAAGRTPWLFGAVAGIAVVALLPSVTGLVLGGAVVVATVRVLRRIEPAPVRAEREQTLADLPWAVDLIAAALRAGAPVDGAVLAVAAALDGPIATRLQRIGRSLRLGSTPAEAWQHLADLPPARRLVAAAERSAASGSALAGALRRCADDLRADAAVRRQAGVQRSGVLIVLPLGLCFLPAFVLAGLVPVVLAVLGEVL